MTTDQGSDIATRRKDTLAECDHVDTTRAFDSECFAHQYHSMTRNLCKAVDEVLMNPLHMGFRLNGTVAKTLNGMRDNALTLTQVWMDLYPETAGASTGRVPPPNPCQGDGGDLLHALSSCSGCAGTRH